MLPSGALMTNIQVFPSIQYGNMDRKIEKRNGNMETRKERAGTKRGKLDRD